MAFCWKTLPFQRFRGIRAQIKECDGNFMQIIVRDNNVEQALRALKKKLQREGVYREMKLRRHYEKPSEKRARERAAAIRRARKLERKRAEREGTTRS
jgi:small subunit ribosomal protein S21